MIDARGLIACGIQPTQAKAFAPVLQAVFERFGIATLEQRAGFVAQASHESHGFTLLEEALWYRSGARIYEVFKRLRPMGAPALEAYAKNPQGLANLAYTNVNGNGLEASGDGWRYRGSGIFQLTGRDNFRRAGAALGRAYVEQPELVRTNSEDAVLTAGWFWSTNGLNALMAAGKIDQCSTKINGGLNGIEERRRLYTDCLAALKP